MATATTAITATAITTTAPHIAAEVTAGVAPVAGGIVAVVDTAAVAVETAGAGAVTPVAAADMAAVAIIGVVTERAAMVAGSVPATMIAVVDTVVVVEIMTGPAMILVVKIVTAATGANVVMMIVPAPTVPKTIDIPTVAPVTTEVPAANVASAGIGITEPHAVAQNALSADLVTVRNAGSTTDPSAVGKAVGMAVSDGMTGAMIGKATAAVIGALIGKATAAVIAVMTEIHSGLIVRVGHSVTVDPSVVGRAVGMAVSGGMTGAMTGKATAVVIAVMIEIHLGATVKVGHSVMAVLNAVGKAEAMAVSEGTIGAMIAVAIGAITGKATAATIGAMTAPSARKVKRQGSALTYQLTMMCSTATSPAK